MQTWVFFVILAVFAVGMVWGFLIGRFKNASQQRAETLETQLSDMRGEMAEYRQQVGQHFTKTADVVNAMTANYRALYEQLVKGAQTLCGDQASYSMLDAADMRFIEHRTERPNGGAAPAGMAPQGGNSEHEPAPGPDTAAAGEASSIAAAMDRSAPEEPAVTPAAAAAEAEVPAEEHEEHEEPRAEAASHEDGAPAEPAEPGAPGDERRGPAPSGGAEAKAAVTESLTIH